MIIQTIKDGPKNLSVLVKGIVTKDFSLIPIIELEKFTAPREGWKGLRLDSAVWAIQEKMGFNLWWRDSGDEVDLILPTESRNGMRFDEGIPSPRYSEGWEGKIYLSSFRCQEISGPKSFFLLLDFDKQ